MDASTILYIVLGLGALILQGYMEKKKKEQARERHPEEIHEDFYEEPVRPIDAHSEKRIEYSMIDIPVSQESVVEEIPEEGISSFRHEINSVQEISEEKSDEHSFVIDPRNLVLYSEIMAPKFRE